MEVVNISIYRWGNCNLSCCQMRPREVAQGHTSGKLGINSKCLWPLTTTWFLPLQVGSFFECKEEVHLDYILTFLSPRDKNGSKAKTASTYQPRGPFTAWDGCLICWFSHQKCKIPKEISLFLGTPSIQISTPEGQGTSKESKLPGYLGKSLRQEIEM